MKQGKQRRVFWDEGERLKVFAAAAALQTQGIFSDITAVRVAQEQVLPTKRQRALTKTSGTGWQSLKSKFNEFKLSNALGYQPQPGDASYQPPLNNVQMLGGSTPAPTAPTPTAPTAAPASAPAFVAPIGTVPAPAGGAYAPTVAQQKDVVTASRLAPPAPITPDMKSQFAGLKSSIEVITPQIAEAWLNGVNTNNRKLRSGIAEKYAADMREGRWTICDTPIIFYEDGSLGSGQHRLWAIIESNTSQQFVVWRGYPRSAALNVDTGAKRTVVDNAHISGEDNELNSTVVAAAIAIEVGGIGGGGRQQLSYSQKLAIVRKHRTAAFWAAGRVKRARYLSGSPVLGAVGRAFYFEHDHDRLQKFCEVLGTGFSEGPEDSAAIAIRNYLLKLGAEKISATSNLMWRDVFLRVQNAIKYFMQKLPLKVIKNVADEPYRLKNKHSALQSDAAQRVVAVLKAEPGKAIIWNELVKRTFGNRNRELVQQVVAELAGSGIVTLSSIRPENSKRMATLIRLEPTHVDGTSATQ